MTPSQQGKVIRGQRQDVPHCIPYPSKASPLGGWRCFSLHLLSLGTPPPHPGLILPPPRCSAPSGSAPAAMGIGVFPTSRRLRGVNQPWGGRWQRWLQPPHHPPQAGASPLPAIQRIPGVSS